MIGVSHTRSRRRVVANVRILDERQIVSESAFDDGRGLLVYLGGSQTPSGDRGRAVSVNDIDSLDRSQKLLVLALTERPATQVSLHQQVGVT